MASAYDLSKIPSAEDDDESLDEDFDPSRPSLESTATAGHAFSLCWSREVRSVLDGLDSQRLKDPLGPWVVESPFDTDHVRLSAVVPDSLGHGGLSSSGHYRDGFSTTTESGTDHLSAALGLTIGYPFLNASVTAKYDRTVVSDKNEIKASRNASCRVGRVVLDRTPRLSRAALTLLGQPNGPARFRARFGDYYVAGYGLGADAGACMSAGTESETSHERLEVTVTVKVLFFEESITHTEEWAAQSRASSLSFSAYSTLDPGGAPVAVSIKAAEETKIKGAGGKGELAERKKKPLGGGEVEALRKTAVKYLDKVRELQSEVKVAMTRAGLVDGARLSLADCATLCQSGLVVELLLAPFARLNQYVESVGVRSVGL